MGSLYEHLAEQIINFSILQSRNSTHGANTFQIWKNSAVGAEPAGEIAHLVPASVQAANSYWFVTDFLFGMDEKRTWKETECLLHGTMPRRAKSDNIKGAGIKHMVTNKVLLAGPNDYFDSAPCVIIFPILKRCKALDWTLGSYKAIMLIDGYDSENTAVESVANFTHFTHKGDMKTASPEDIEIATTLLQNYTQAIMNAQQHEKPKEVHFTISADATTAFYPQCVGDLSFLDVREVTFCSNDSTDGHPAPDPLLLVTKAVAVLQKRHGFNIVATAEPITDGVGPSDHSIQAEEDLLRRREEAMSYPDPVGMNILVSH